MKANHVPTVVVSISRAGYAGARDRRTLANEGAGGYDGETNPQAPDDTAQHGDNLMAEERWEGYDEEDGDGNEPSGGDVAQLLGEGSQLLQWG